VPVPISRLDLAMAALFAFAAAVQLNDPDPVRWVTIYVAASALSFAAVRARHVPAVAFVVAVDRMRAGAVGGWLERGHRHAHLLHQVDAPFPRSGDPGADPRLFGRSPRAASGVSRKCVDHWLNR